MKFGTKIEKHNFNLYFKHYLAFISLIKTKF